MGLLVNAAALAVAAVAAASVVIPRVDLPGQLLGHHAEFVERMLTDEVATELMDMAKATGSFRTNAADTLAYTVKREHIGEARPPVNGSCAHPFLAPNKAGDECVMPGRIDVARHFIKTGGFPGLKEPYEVGVSRVQSFGRYIFDLDEFPIARRLFESGPFLDNAKTVCPADRQLLDPFQFNLIIQVPGQTVALHLDANVFWGATRVEFPQWLLVAMKFSGLFEDEFVNQVQVVGYFHKWQDVENRSGDFVYWDDNGDAKHIAPVGLAGSVVDGSKVVHSGTVYRPGEKPPLMDKSKVNTLDYVGDDRWEIRTEGVTRATYKTDDLRCTVVYRARCFADEAERDRFHAQRDEDMMSLDEVLGRLLPDLVRRGKLSSVEEGLAMDRLELGMLIMEYIKYPLPPDAVIPFNYCALPRLLPWTAPLLNLIC